MIGKLTDAHCAANEHLRILIRQLAFHDQLVGSRSPPAGPARTGHTVAWSPSGSGNSTAITSPLSALVRPSVEPRLEFKLIPRSSDTTGSGCLSQIAPGKAW